MFSLSQSDELVFQIHYPFPEQQQQQQQGTIIQQDLVTDQASTVPTNLNNLKRHRNKSSLSTGDDIKDECTGNGNKQKKVMHIEIERLMIQTLAYLTHLEKLATQMREVKAYINPHQIIFAIDVGLFLTVLYEVRINTPTLQSRRPHWLIYPAMVF